MEVTGHTHIDGEKTLFLEAEPGKHTHTLIFLHGLGDTGYQFQEIFRSK